MTCIDGSVYKFLGSHPVGHLGTVDPEGQPHVVPICFAATEHRIYSIIDDKPKRVTGQCLKRLKNISSNPRVCLTVDRYSDDWSRLGFVMIHGMVKIIDSGQDHMFATSLLRTRYSQYEKMDMSGRLVLVIQPENVITWGSI